MGNRGSQLSGKETVSDRHLELVAKEIGARWHLLALDLNFQRKEIFEIEKENPTLEEQCRKMLQRWYIKLPQSTDAMNELTAALQKCEREDVIGKFLEGPPESKEWRIVLVGKTGSGKSDTGNHILQSSLTGKDKKPFTTQLSGSSVTTDCEYATTEVADEKILVVDTPGVFDTEKDNEDIIPKITKFVLYVQPGPHAILVIVQIGRQTEVNQQSVKLLKKIFENEIYNHMIVVFTRKDDLIHQNMSLEDYLKTIKPGNEVKKLVEECHGRCFAFNNRANSEENDKQVKELLGMVKGVVEANGGRYYISALQAELAERLVTDDDRQNPEGFRLKVKETDATDKSGWMWQGVVLVASMFGYDWKA